MATTMKQAATTLGQVATELRQHIPSLLDIQSDKFADQYYLGMAWALYEVEAKIDGPLSAGYILSVLKLGVEKKYFDGKHAHQLPRLGFLFGMVHGAVVRPDGTIRPNVHSLIILADPVIQHAYSVARECAFIDIEQACPRMSEDELLGYLSDTVNGEDWQQTEAPHTTTDDEWYSCIGDIAGTMSAHLFPWTDEDTRAASERLRKFEAKHGYIPEAHDPTKAYYNLLHYKAIEAVAV